MKCRRRMSFPKPRTLFVLAKADSSFPFFQAYLPKTSLPLHSSWTRQVSSISSSGMVSGSPQIYTVNPPMGGKKILMSGRVINSGYIPLVMRKIDCRKWDSVVSNRLATSGKYQTGSMAALATTDCPVGSRIFPSGTNRPVRTASRHSGRSMWAFVTAIVGRTSHPLSK